MNLQSLQIEILLSPLDSTKQVYKPEKWNHKKATASKTFPINQISSTLRYKIQRQLNLMKLEL